MKNRNIVGGAFSLLLLSGTIRLTHAQTFTHPGISHSQADLDRMKNNVNVEPYKTAYAAFANMGYSQSTNTGQGPYTSETYGHGQFEIRNDAQVAHQNAVMWYVTGNAAYRTNAINIMMGWANTLTSFDQSDYLTAGTAVYDFVNAGEIIRATGGGAWAAADITKFQNWLITYLYPPLLSPGNSISANVLQAAGAGGLEIKGLIALGIFCDRRDIYNFGISSFQHNGGFSYGLVEYINASGQNFENSRDVGHASGNLSAFTQEAYMAWNQGLDLFGTSNNLLAKAYEIQAKFDLGWDVAPVAWTAPDGSFHGKMSGENRTAFDNLESDSAYNIYHNIKGLQMPYTKLSADLKFPTGSSFYYRIDNSGVVPTPPLTGEPAVTGVRIYEDYLSGSYLTNFQPGNYTYTDLKNGGMQANGSGPVSSIRLPVGWTVTAWDQDNFAGNSVVITGTLQNQGVQNMGDIGFNDRLCSMKVVGGGTLPVFNGTYQIVNQNSGKNAEVAGASTADGANVDQRTYVGAPEQLWRVEGLGGGRYKFANLNSNKVMEVSSASLSNGAAVDQRTYVPAPNLATGGTASASAENSGSGEGSAQAFDGNTGTKWSVPANGGTGWLQYHFAGTTKQAVDQYQVISANDVQQRDPAAWQLQGSNDGTNWTTLDTQSGQVFPSRYQTQNYSIPNTTAYAYYRLNVTANYGGSGYSLQLSELGLYSSKSGGVHQRWTFTPAAGSAYGRPFKIVNVNSSQNLDVYGLSQSDGGNIVQWPDNGGINQQWTLKAP